MERLTLSPRLGQIADWVPRGRTLADVGTDHALLPIWLRLREAVPRAVASDLRPGPLARARETGRRFGVTGIDYRLCPGLRDIAPQEAETVVMAGMGAETIIGILRPVSWVGEGGGTLLLQPQSREELLRRYLSENGFAITRETVVSDRGGLYIVMEARRGRQRLSQEALWAGAALEDGPLTDQYRARRRRRLEQALSGLCQARHRDEGRIETIRGLLCALDEKREDTDHAHGTGD